MIAVYLRFLKDKYWSLFLYSLSTIVFLEMYIAMFPSLNTVAQEKFDVLMQSFPKEIWAVVGVDPGAITFTKISSFLSMEQYSMVWPLIVIIFSISLANSMIATEVEKGTIEQILALPLQRWKIFVGRFTAAVSILVLYTFTTIYAVVPLAKMHKIDITGIGNWQLAVSGLLFGVTVLSIASLSSSFFSEKGKATFVTAGVILAFYGANIVGGLLESNAWIKDYSIFHYFSGSTNLVKAEFVDNYLLFFLSISVVSTVLALTRFIFRDTSV